MYDLFYYFVMILVTAAARVTYLKTLYKVCNEVYSQQLARFSNKNQSDHIQCKGQDTIVTRLI